MSDLQHNPYAVPASDLTAESSELERRPWYKAFLRPAIAIGFSGAMFGTAVGGVIGFFIGGLIAVPVSYCCSLFVFGIHHVLTRSDCYGNRLFVLSAAAGAMSGVVSLALLQGLAVDLSVLIPGAIGLLGGAIGAVWEAAKQRRTVRRPFNWNRRRITFRSRHDTINPQPESPFELQSNDSETDRSDFN